MSSSESENEAPEIVSLKSSRKESKEQARAQQERDKTLSRKQKERNQTRDARLKAEKESKKSKGETKTNQTSTVPRKEDQAVSPTGVGDVIHEGLDDDGDMESTRLQRRMEKAMKDAEEETDEGDEDEEELAADAMDEDEDLTESGDSTEESEEGEEDEEDEEPEDHTNNPDYLPEHFFTKARLQEVSKKPKTTVKVQGKLQGKRRKKNRRKEEKRVIGSRTVQVLRDAAHVGAGRTTPNPKAKKFLKNQLKGGLRTKGWERKTVTVGSLASRSGPAARFIRA